MLYHLLMGRKEDSERTALHIKREKYTFCELHRWAKAFSVFLQNKGIRQGDRVAIIANVNIDTVIAILGCIFYGAVFVPIDARFYKENDCRIAKEIEAKLIINGLPQELMKSSMSYENRIRERMNEKAQVYILYTSGSTSRPKGIIACVRQVVFCIEKINLRLQNGTEDKILCAIPLSFDYGLYQIFLSLASGSELYLEDGRVLQHLPGILQKEGITAFPAVPSMLALLCRAKLLQRVKLPCLRYICWTGDRLSLRIVEELHSVFPDVELLPMYGLTECKRVSIMPLNCYEKTKRGSCGLPLDDVQVCLQNVDSNRVGELIVIGENVMEAIGKDETFSIDPMTGQRMLKTGDLFFIDEDGFLYFYGRKKRMIKSNGFRIGNAQIEGILEVLESVSEVRIEGIPDDVSGERIGAAIFGNEEAFQQEYEGIKDSISTLLRPQVFYFSRKPLPKNKNGKFDDKKISRILAERGSKWNGK